MSTQEKDKLNLSETSAVQFWLTSTYAEMDRNPPSELFSVLRGSNRAEDLTVPVVNNAKALIRMIFPECVPRTGNTEQGSSGIHRSVIALYVYYRFLDAIVKHLLPKDCLNLELDLTEKSSVTKRLQNSHFHNALLCLVTEMVAYVFNDTAFPWATDKLKKHLHTFEIWIVIEYILMIKDNLQLPSAVVCYVEDVQECIMREKCFLYHSSLYTYFIHGGGCLHLAGNYSMIKIFIIKFSNFILKSTESMCVHLINDCDCNGDVFFAYCWDLVDRVLFDHFYLFFGRKTILPVLCSVYCVSKIFKMELSFDDLIQKTMKILSWTDVADIKEVQLSKCKDFGVNFGTIQKFYDDVFLPSCQNDIEEIKTEICSQSV